MDILYFYLYNLSIIKGLLIDVAGAILALHIKLKHRIDAGKAEYIAKLEYKTNKAVVSALETQKAKVIKLEEKVK